VKKPMRLATSALTLVVTMAAAPSLYAAGFGDMFNPGRWFGGNNDDDYYYDGPYGGYGPGPYGVPGYGYGPYAAPGYGYGYGALPYGYAPGLTPGVAPGYSAPAVAAPATIAPAAGSVDAKDQEIEELKRRIEQLETARRGPPPASSAPDGWPAAPAFRPMDQY
jgi:hypothetical protein